MAGSLKARIERLAAAMEGVPRLSADWRDTNHFELHDSTGKDFFWFSADEPGLRCDTDRGQRFGKLLDLAAAATDMLPIIAELVARLEVAEAFLCHGSYCALTKDDALAACDLKEGFEEDGH